MQTYALNTLHYHSFCCFLQPRGTKGSRCFYFEKNVTIFPLAARLSPADFTGSLSWLLGEAEGEGGEGEGRRASFASLGLWWRAAADDSALSCGLCDSTSSGDREKTTTTTTTTTTSKKTNKKKTLACVYWCLRGRRRKKSSSPSRVRECLFVRESLFCARVFARHESHLSRRGVLSWFPADVCVCVCVWLQELPGSSLHRGLGSSLVRGLPKPGSQEYPVPSHRIRM